MCIRSTPFGPAGPRATLLSYLPPPLPESFTPTVSRVGPGRQLSPQAHGPHHPHPRHRRQPSASTSRGSSSGGGDSSLALAAPGPGGRDSDTDADADPGPPAHPPAPAPAPAAGAAGGGEGMWRITCHLRGSEGEDKRLLKLEEVTNEEGGNWSGFDQQLACGLTSSSPVV